MAPEPKWETWRRMDCARLYELVALLARVEPDSIEVEYDYESWPQERFLVESERFHDFLRMAESSVSARTLACYGGSSARAAMNDFLMSEFSRWALAKELPIPPELKWAGGTSTVASSASDATSIDGIDGLRDLIKALGGPVLGDAAAVRNFAKKAGILRDGDNPKRTKRTWMRAEIEPMLTAAIESWRQSGNK
ncbi:hypothetical protein F0U61_37645 [Archangium violaceum]|uniref:hypothetical protein n=1 Tax=Archangium violaceum TaxID=83451 RepID=UPI002B2AC160|nr:hypothetical protein F0U61_37645 [Archangium violaceum]